ncbi:MAG: saccharopine dehydrogenase NADP-binding domain-containing protein [Antricoccus sp.]
MAKVVLFGATGYTGQLVAAEMVKRGMRPLLAARNQQALDELAKTLGGDLSTQVADVNDPASVAALVDKGDVLVSTVGPFIRWGRTAADAAIAKGAHYIDSTGEGAFIRSIFDDYGPRAKSAGITMMTALGYDWVPGNLAGALATVADDRVCALKIGYFNAGPGSRDGMSGGTAASSATAMFYPAYAYRGGAIVTERMAATKHEFGEVEVGRVGRAFSVGSTEAFSLPRVYEQLRDVEVLLGWNDPDKVQAQAAALEPLLANPARQAELVAQAEKKTPGSTGGPDQAARSLSSSVILAEGFDKAGNRLCEVRCSGVNGYDFTAAFIALTAQKIADGEVTVRGSIGPLEAFGLERLREYVAQSGLTAE